MDKNTYFKIVVTLFFLVFAYLSYLVIRPFSIALISAVILTYIFYPIYKLLLRLVKRKSTSALLITALIIVLLTIPMVIFLSAIREQAIDNYIYFQENFNSNTTFAGCTDDTIICKLSTQIDKIKETDFFKNNIKLDEIVKGATSATINWITRFLINLPYHILNLFIMFFAMFFMFIDGQKIAKYINQLIPLKIKHKRRIAKRLDDVVFAVVYGNLIVAAVQGSIAFVGYLIFGVNTPILWGVLTAVAALIPFFGTAAIWVPLSIMLLISGILQNNMIIVGRSLGLFLYGTFVISLVDNFIKPYIIGDKANIHPLVILLGVFGGISLIGPVGLILGPIILALFLTSIRIYMEERYDETKKVVK